MKVGILALQGDFHAHGKVFDRLGVPWQEVRAAGDFEGISGLVIPGGESTTLLKLMKPDCRAAILDLAQGGGILYGTCAGALLLCREVQNPSQDCLGLLDAVMVRNGYGRQVESFVLRDGEHPACEGEELPSELVFIRAPLFKELGPEVEVLARVHGAPVYVRQGNIMATTFHPELTTDLTVHARFRKMMEASLNARPIPRVTKLTGEA